MDVLQINLQSGTAAVESNPAINVRIAIDRFIKTVLGNQKNMHLRITGSLFLCIFDHVSVLTMVVLKFS
jgi:hypothetical protein